MESRIQFKKRRNPNACDMCKHKKIRCDSAVMPGNRCSECISYNCECTHSGAKEKKRSSSIALGGQTQPVHRSSTLPNLPATSSPAASATSPSSSEASHYHPMVNGVIGTLTNPEASTLTALMKVSDRLFDLERIMAELRSSIGSSFVSSSPKDYSPNREEAGPAPAETDPASEVQLAEQLSTMTIRNFRGRHFGPSSVMTLVGTALKTIRNSNQNIDAIAGFRGIRRPMFWNILPWESDLHGDLPIHQFPEPSLLFELIDLFFEEINVALPLLHKPTFMGSIAQNEHLMNHQFGETVLGVCAIASRYSDDPSVLLEGDDTRLSSGWKWFRQIRLFRKAFTHSPSLYELQTNILCTMYLHGTSQPETSWMMVSLGIRYAQDVGAHRKRSVPSAENELWKRAFWILLCIDTIMGSFLGRPRTVNPEDFDVDLPFECDDEYWPTEDPWNQGGSDQPFQQPRNKPSTISAFVAYVKLMLILDSAQRSLFSVKASKMLASPQYAQDTMLRLESELNEWLSSLPDHLQWDNYQETEKRTCPFFKQIVVLYAAYHHVHMLIHRPFISISAKPSPMFSTSWTICTNAARACIRIIKTFPGPYLPFPNIQFALLSSAVISLLDRWKTGRPRHDPSQGRKNIEDCLEILIGYENRWLGSGRAVDVLRELIQLDDLASAVTPKETQLSPVVQGSQYDPGHSFFQNQDTTMFDFQPQDPPTRIPQDIFGITTASFPTLDLDFLEQISVTGEDNPFSMLF